MKKLSFVRITLFVLISLFFISFSGKKLVAQTDTYDEVIIEMQKDDKIKEVKTGKKIRIWYEGEKHSGRLDSITTGTIFVDGQEFEIDKIDKIGIKFKGTQITGAIVGTTGLIITSLGGLIIYQAYQEESLGAVILIVFGVIVEAIGIPVLAIGASIFFIGKKYKKSKGWNYKAVQVN